MSGVTIMKMINSTSITSMSGVTFGSALTPDPPPVDIAISLHSSERATAYWAIGPPVLPAAVLNSRVKRERPNSPATPLMR